MKKESEDKMHVHVVDKVMVTKKTTKKLSTYMGVTT